MSAAPFVDDDGGGDGAPDSESPPSIAAEGVKGPPGLQRCDLHLQRYLRMLSDEPRMELLQSGA